MRLEAMPDARKHRGPDHADGVLFAESRKQALGESVADLSWLLGRGYAEAGALKLVGDRRQLRRRQREAVRRSACSDQAVADRRSRMLPPDEAGPDGVRIDGLNLMITVESAMSGGLLFVGRDGCMRDLASIHGSYRQVEETRGAARTIGIMMEMRGIAREWWLLDSPVSNSGRLRRLLLEEAAAHGWSWQVDLVRNPDAVLVEPGPPVVTSDSGILDACGAWVNLAREIVVSHVQGARIVDLS